MRHPREAEATETLANGLGVERLRAGFPGVAALNIFTALTSVAGALFMLVLDILSPQA